MNRIRKIDNKYLVLITPDIKISPSDSSLMLGSWQDSNLSNYYVIKFDTMNDAMAEAFKYPDINWYRIVLNHQDIFIRLRNTITSVINAGILEKVQIRSKLMSADEFKNTMMDRVINGGGRFRLRDGFPDIISFTIVSMYSYVLFKVAKLLETYTDHLYSDTLRIKEKKVVNGKIIYLFGITEAGSIYQIKLMPSLFDESGVSKKNVMLQDQIDKKALLYV